MTAGMDAARAGDLLAFLHGALEDGRTLAFAVVWAPDGRDPLPAAWAACGEPSLMRAVVSAAYGRAAWEAALAACHDAARRAGLDADDDGPARRADRARVYCDALRALYPTLTLAEVLGAARHA